VTYLAEETGLESGRPVELFEFSIGSTGFFFTSAEDQIVLSGNTYEPEAIAFDSSVVAATDRERQVVNVTLPAANAFPTQFSSVSPDQSATFTVKRFHRGDAGSEVRLLFKGKVVTVTFIDNGLTAEIAIQSIESAMSRSMPRRTSQILCNLVHYDQGFASCKVNQASFKFTGTVSSVSGNDITVTSVTGSVADPTTSGPVGGRVEYLGERRLVTDRSGDVLTLHYPFSTTPLNQSVDVFAGCNRTIAACKADFGNVINFGGNAYLPERNIFQDGVDS